MIDPASLMKRVAGIRLLTMHLVDEQLSGDYHSSFKGQGIEFDEVREYVPGDDIRSIDWNVTARTGFPYVKRYSEERELTVMFLVDVSGSQVFGSRGRPKSELAALLACVLAMAAVRNEDKVGLIDFADRIVKTIPARKGRTAVNRLVREVLAEEGTRSGTDIAGALRFLNGVQKRRAVVFLVSDFLTAQSADYEKLLRVVARRHDVICIPVSDPAEAELPNVGLAELEDPESGELVLVDTADPSVRRQFAAVAKSETEHRDRFFARSGIDNVPVATDRPYIQSIRALFKRRASKR